MAFWSLGDNLPSVCVEIDFTNTPFSSTATWTDVTSYVRRFSFSRGREGELEAASPGQAAFTLSNNDRRFDPTFASSPYYPNVLPMRKVRIRCQWAGVTYNLFRGYIDDFPLSWPEDGKDAIVEVTATDAFKILNLYDLGGKSYASHLDSVRMGTVLADAGFGTADYSIQTGNVTIVASGTIAQDTMALGHLLDVNQSEPGVFFVDGGGTIQWQNKTYRYTLASQGTISNAAGGVTFKEPRSLYGDKRIFNRAVVTPSGGTAEVSTAGTASTGQYGTRTLALSGLQAAQNDALNQAQYLTYKYGTPFLEIPEVQVVPQGQFGAALWPTVLASEISKPYTFQYVLPGTLGTITQGQYLEKIQMDVSADRGWQTRWRLSSGSAGVFWVLDSSALDVSTVPG